MKITADLRSLFAPDVRGRGERYAFEGRVTFVEGGARAVTAEVRGTSKYRVQVFWDGRRIKIRCTCPFFGDDGNPCKHLWATLLAAEERRFLSAIPEGGRWTDGRHRPPEPGPGIDDLDEGGDDGNGHDEGDGSEARGTLPAPAERRTLPGWAARLLRIEESARMGHIRSRSPASRPIRVGYVIDADETKKGWGVAIETWVQHPGKDGEWGERKPHFVERGRLDHYDLDDRMLLAIIVNLPPFHTWAPGGMLSRFRMPFAMDAGLLPMLAATGRLLVRRSRSAEPESAEADDGPPWKFRMWVRRDDGGKDWVLGGSFLRGTESMDLDEPGLVLGSGFLFARGRMARLDPGGAFDWIGDLRSGGAINAPEKDGLALAEQILALPGSPAVDLPEELRFEEVRMAPARRILIRGGEKEGSARTRLRAEVAFIYGDRAVRMSNRGHRIVDAGRRRALLRDDQAECEALDRLLALGLRFPRSRIAGLPPDEQPDLELAPGKLSKVVAALTAEGWTVEAEGKLYDELRDHYRAALLGSRGGDGGGPVPGSKIQVLEALLRLRQAACHPGLIDRKRAGEASTKVDLLLDHLAEVTEEGHKALVFSQFTTLLGIVKDRLDGRGVAYEHLDGRTRDRQAKVDRFQTDPGCKLFLISLKAGGLGLNLTAAEYVFLLDPWWNPAVEAQAIDRAHRIGQTRQVMACRLIARGTVEEKVLELQAEKRALADAIISADNSLIRDLTREDLERLLS